MEDPTVSVAQQHTEIAVTETVIGDLVGKIRLEFGVQQAHVHDYILVTCIDACQQRAGTAFLVLGEAIGRSLAVVGVVEDVIGIEAVTLALESRENLATMPLAQPVEVQRALVVLAVIGLDKNARRGEGELQAAVADELSRQQVSRVDHVGETEAHAADLETEERGDIAVHLHIGFPLAQMPRVEVNPVVVLEHDFPLLAAGFAWVGHIGSIIVVEGMVKPTVGLEAEVNNRRINDGSVVDAPPAAQDAVPPCFVFDGLAQH